MLGFVALGTLACATTAQAAQGALLINGHPYPNAESCVTIHKFPVRLRIVNNSAELAHVYLLPGCKGGVTSAVNAGAKASSIGASVLAE
jgi:hypothetical protein